MLACVRWCAEHTVSSLVICSWIWYALNFPKHKLKTAHDKLLTINRCYVSTYKLVYMKNVHRVLQELLQFDCFVNCSLPSRSIQWVESYSVVTCRTITPPACRTFLELCPVTRVNNSVLLGIYAFIGERI